MTTPQQVPAPAPAQKLPKAGFIWGPIIFVVTAIIGISMIVASFVVIANTISDFKTVDAGSTAEVKLGSGEWYVFAGAGSSLGLRQVQVSITDPSGDQVLPKSNSGDYSSDSDGMQYQSIGSFDVPTSGTYTVEVTGPTGTTAKVGQIPLATFLVLLIGGIAIGALGFVVALVVLIIAIVRRTRAKKRLSGPTTWAPPTGTPGVPAPAAATIAPTPPVSMPPPASPTPPPPPAPPVPPGT